MALELAHEGELLAGGLEATVAELRRGVDELELDLLHRRPAGLREARLAEGEDALLDADGAALDQDVVLLALTVVREAAHRGDGLLGGVDGGGRIEVGGLALNLLDAAGDAVDLLVHLSSMVVPALSGSWDSEPYSGWVP